MINVSKLKSLQTNQILAIETKTLMARDENFMKKMSVWQAAAVFKGQNVSSIAVILIYLQLNQTRVVKTAYHTNLYGILMTFRGNPFLKSGFSDLASFPVSSLIDCLKFSLWANRLRVSWFAIVLCPLLR